MIWRSGLLWPGKLPPDASPVLISLIETIFLDAFSTLRDKDTSLGALRKWFMASKSFVIVDTDLPFEPVNDKIFTNDVARKMDSHNDFQLRESQRQLKMRGDEKTEWKTSASAGTSVSRCRWQHCRRFVELFQIITWSAARSVTRIAKLVRAAIERHNSLEDQYGDHWETLEFRRTHLSPGDYWNQLPVEGQIEVYNLFWIRSTVGLRVILLTPA